MTASIFRLGLMVSGPTCRSRGGDPQETSDDERLCLLRSTYPTSWPTPVHGEISLVPRPIGLSRQPSRSGGGTKQARLVTHIPTKCANWPTPSTGVGAFHATAWASASPGAHSNSRPIQGPPREHRPSTAGRFRRVDEPPQKGAARAHSAAMPGWPSARACSLNSLLRIGPSSRSASATGATLARVPPTHSQLVALARVNPRGPAEVPTAAGPHGRQVIGSRCWYPGRPTG